jgi:deoxyribodipyrimidine photo-lyase
MIESLEDLDDELKKSKRKLYLFYGHPDKIVERCIQELKIEAVFVNRDYTPYSCRRDKKIEAVCRRHGIAFIQSDDALLHPPEETLKADGRPYTIFTPWFRNSSKLNVPEPSRIRAGRMEHGPIAFAKDRSLFRKVLPNRCTLPLQGKRTAAMRILDHVQNFSCYSLTRDFPAIDTTHLSPYLKFNLCSVREAYHAIVSKCGVHHDLVRSLYWRDFFTSIAFFFPHIFKRAFRSRFDEIVWKYDRKSFQKWCQGKTGFPIVDAGMRELNQTGWMHNRVRMICASFLVKDLHIDWRWGEKYFAQMLIDYDPAVNNGNWQWAASTGCDAQPYFRIFNPWNQQKKFDPDCIYIKRWIPELQSLPPNLIQRWELEYDASIYPRPMLNHAAESRKAIQMFRTVLQCE